MNIEETLVLEIWDIFKDSIAPKQKVDKAYLLLKAFIDSEIIDDVKALADEDAIIDEAIELFEEEDEEYWDEE